MNMFRVERGLLRGRAWTDNDAPSAQLEPLSASATLCRPRSINNEPNEGPYFYMS